MATQTEDALSYYRVRGLYFLAVVFVATIDVILPSQIVFAAEMFGSYSRPAHIFGSYSRPAHMWQL